jgi:glyoxylate carboligase
MAPITQINSRRCPEVSAAAAELRLALNVVRDLVRQGTTSGEAWNQADVRQRKATVAWRLALWKVQAPIRGERR